MIADHCLRCQLSICSRLLLPPMIRSLFSRDATSSHSLVHGELDRQSRATHGDDVSKMFSQPIKMLSNRTNRSYQEETVVSGRLPALNAAAHLLRQVEAVHVKHSTRRHVHRYYTISLFLRSDRAPLVMRDPDYIIEHPHGALMALRDDVTTHSEARTKNCADCRCRLAFLHEHTKRHVFRTRKHQEQWISVLVHSLIRFTVGGDGGVYLGACEGCDEAILTLARFLKQQHQPSTGIL